MSDAHDSRQRLLAAIEAAYAPLGGTLAGNRCMPATYQAGQDLRPSFGLGTRRCQRSFAGFFDNYDRVDLRVGV